MIESIVGWSTLKKIYTKILEESVQKNNPFFSTAMFMDFVFSFNNNILAKKLIRD